MRGGTYAFLGNSDHVHHLNKKKYTQVKSLSRFLSHVKDKPIGKIRPKDQKRPLYLIINIAIIHSFIIIIIHTAWQWTGFLLCLLTQSIEIEPSCFSWGRMLLSYSFICEPGTTSKQSLAAVVALIIKMTVMWEDWPNWTKAGASWWGGIPI